MLQTNHFMERGLATYPILQTLKGCRRRVEAFPGIYVGIRFTLKRKYLHRTKSFGLIRKDLRLRRCVGLGVVKWKAEKDISIYERIATEHAS